MFLGIQRLAGYKCKSLDQSKEFIRVIDGTAEEYEKNIGKRPPDESLVRVLWEVMDEKTLDMAEAEGIDKMDTTYIKLCKFVKNKAQKKLVRGNLKKSRLTFAGPSHMDIGLVGAPAPDEPPEAPLGPEYDEETFKALGKGKGKGSKGKGRPLTCYTCKGIGHPRRICTSQPGTNDHLTCSHCSGKGHN